MVVILVAAVLGLSGGLLAGGRLSSMKGLQPRGLVGLAGAVVAVGTSRVVSVIWPSQIGATRALFLGGLILLLSATFANVRRVPGAIIFALGLSMNLAVVLVNGSMLYNQESLVSAGIVAEDATDIPKSSVHGRPQTEDDSLTALSEHVPIDFLVMSEVVSPGDLIMALGVGAMLFLSLSPSRKGARRRIEVLDTPRRVVSNRAREKFVADRPVRPPHVVSLRPLVGDLVPDSSGGPDPGEDLGRADEYNRDKQLNMKADSLDVLIDLTADRATRSHRYDVDAELTSTMSLIDLVDPALDDDDGPLPGETFWAARNELKSHQRV
jgi:Family of unknown function (DUF5317)